MANVAVVRRRFLITAGVLALISLVAAVYSLFSIGPTPEEKWREEAQVTQERKTKLAQTAPLADISGKIGKAQQDIRSFYTERLPARYSYVSEEVGKLATQTGVQLSDVRYSPVDSEIPDLQRLTIEANLTGDYSRAVKFINAVERSKMFLLIDNVALAPEQQGGNVTLQIRMQTFLRSGAAGETQTASESALPAQRSGT
jgi:Tfp pilus assembly protein PilO